MKAKHPNQPLVIDKYGVVRFKGNVVVNFLFSVGKLDLNELAVMVGNKLIPREDYEQITQLMGYSVSGYGDLSTTSKDRLAWADAEAERLLSERKMKK
jgi:hypothetical protein